MHWIIITIVNPLEVNKFVTVAYLTTTVSIENIHCAHALVCWLWLTLYVLHLIVVNSVQLVGMLSQGELLDSLS